MFRQSVAGLRAANCGQQRRLFLLVFLWTCLCLVIFRASLFPADEARGQLDYSGAQKLHARAAWSSVAPPPSASVGQSLRPAAGGPPRRPPEQLAGAACRYDYPSLFELQFNNVYWQKFTNRIPARNASEPAPSNSPATFYLYNAYYDDRWRAGLPSVRVLAMVDRIQPPPTNCLLWSNRRPAESAGQRQPRPLVTRASFVYAWYPKWGNYRDGLLQPFIVTCPVPRAHLGLVPDSVSLVEVPPELARPPSDHDDDREARRRRRDAPDSQASIAMPPAFSSSSLSPSVLSSAASAVGSGTQQQATASRRDEHQLPKYDCRWTAPITNNLPVYNQRPPKKKKFAVCVKGLDFPHEDVSVRLVEWIELLNLLGAGKIFLYNLDVHENISKVLDYYQKRGIVELNPLTLPGDQPNLPEYQHLYLKNKLTAKRQNELIPYNDCLYRNLHSYQYLALLDIDEIIMPLRHHNWYDLMQEVESVSLSEQNYSRASYNVRNVYFFDDLAGPLGTTSSSSAEPEAADSDKHEEISHAGGASSRDEPASSSTNEHEVGIPKYMHMMSHVYRSKNYTEPGQYVKCFHNTERVVSLHNHFPMNCFGQCTTYSVSVELAHLQHYRKDCVGPLKQSCKNNFRAFTTRDTTIWKYKQQMIRRTTRVLNHLSKSFQQPKQGEDSSFLSERSKNDDSSNNSNRIGTGN